MHIFVWTIDDDEIGIILYTLSDYTNKKGKTFLHTASEQGKVIFKFRYVHSLNEPLWIGITKVAEKVIKGGAIVDAVDIIGRTSLHYATENGNVWFLAFLINYQTECMNECVKSHIVD